MVWLYYRIMGNNLSVVVVYCVFYGMEAASIHNFNYCYRHEFAFYFFAMVYSFLTYRYAVAVRIMFAFLVNAFHFVWAMFSLRKKKHEAVGG